jgi:hypothetical protein
VPTLLPRAGGVERQHRLCGEAREPAELDRALGVGAE